MSDSKKTRKRRGERPDGLIQVSLDIGRDASGKRVRKYFYGHTRAEAERKRDEYKSGSRAPASVTRSVITVADWIETYKAAYRPNVNAAYIRAYEHPYDRLAECIGKMNIADVRESDLQRLLNDMAGMSYSSVEKFRQAVKRVFKKARKNRIIDDDPAEDLELPPCTRGTHRALEAWEVEAILKYWNAPGVRAGLWIMLMLFAGLRRGEMMALDWSAVDLDARTLTVRQVAVVPSNQSVIEQRAKSAAGIRTIPICQPLYDALSSVPAEARDGFVCVSSRGKQLSGSGANEGVRSFLASVGRLLNGRPACAKGRKPKTAAAVDAVADTDPQQVRFYFRAHDLRHTFCTFLYDAGVDVKSAAYFMGHADIRVTMGIYTHLSEQKRSAATDRFLTYAAALNVPDES